MFSFRSPNFWTISNWFVQFPNFFWDYKKFCFVFRNLCTKSKRFGFVSKFLDEIVTFCFCKKKVEHIKKFWFCSKIFGKKKVGTHQKVLVLFQNFWNTEKRSTVGSGTHQNVLVSFRSLASMSERLCFRFGFANITRAPANTLTPLQQSQVNVKAIRVLVEAVRVLV